MATVPVVRRDWVDDAVDAPTWDPGAYEGHDLMIKASNVTHTMMSIRRQWTITTTMGQMDAGR
jgi:hypothetical protein